MDFRRIELKDKAIFEKYLSVTTDKLGWEYCFAMTWIWDAFDETMICDLGDMAIIYTKFYGKCVYFPPLLSDESLLEKALALIEEHSRQNGYAMEVRGLSKAQAEILSDKYAVTTDRGNYDYIYSVQTLINLSGKKLHSKRNFINRFKSTYSYTFREYSEEDRESMLALFDKWFVHSVHETLDLERKVIVRALDYYKELGLKIGVLEVEGNLAAYSISAVENDNVAHAMFEKADTVYDGIYQMINQQTCEKLLSGCKYVNRQEDMNIEGLRQAKSSYYPEILLEKYTVKCK